MKTLEEAPIFSEVVGSPEFQRLKRIAFLGILGYIYAQNYTSRYDHSIAVAKLCSVYSQKKGIEEEDRTYFILAGLLHDIGHSCFSHSLEPVFKERFSITHHSVTQEIILTSPTLTEIWNKYDVTPDKIINILKDSSDDNYSLITNAPINFDTLDGMTRTTSLFEPDSERKDFLSETCKNIFNILTCENDWRKHSEAFDSFWHIKGDIYNTYIYDENVRSSEIIMQEILMNNSKLSREHFLLSDSDMLYEFPSLGFMLNLLGQRKRYSNLKLEIDTLYKYTQRNTRKFFVDESDNLEKYELSSRYKTLKETREYILSFD